MKKILFICLLFVGTGTMVAQNEQPTDSTKFVLPNNVKLFGDFILDMNILMPPKLRQINADPLNSNLPIDYNALFQLPESMIYSRGFAQSYGLTRGYGFFSSGDLYGASFKLNDKVRLNTYGQYDMYGRKIPNQNVLPWEKNNFMGGMELKFNKNFGIRIEVQQRQGPYPF